MTMLQKLGQDLLARTSPKVRRGQKVKATEDKKVKAVGDEGQKVSGSLRSGWKILREKGVLKSLMDKAYQVVLQSQASPWPYIALYRVLTKVLKCLK